MIHLAIQSYGVGGWYRKEFGRGTYHAREMYYGRRGSKVSNAVMVSVLLGEGYDADTGEEAQEQEALPRKDSTGKTAQDTAHQQNTEQTGTEITNSLYYA